MTPETEARFWSRVQKTDGCWEWTWSRYQSGYGAFVTKDTRSRYAHRVSFEIAYGPIPERMFICHHCDNPPCVRPDHLFLGTAKDNSMDMIRKRRSIDGGPHMEEYTVAEAAARLGITVQTVRHRLRKGYLHGRRVGARLWVVSADELARVEAEGSPKPGPKPNAPPTPPAG